MAGSACVLDKNTNAEGVTMREFQWRVRQIFVTAANITIDRGVC